MSLDTGGAPSRRPVSAGLVCFWWDATTDTTTRITDGNRQSRTAAISADGRYVAYESFASNLVPDDTNDVRDVFVWDRSN